MRTWIPPLILFIVLLFALAGIWNYGGGYAVIDKYHVATASIIGLVIGLPLVLWRTLVASNQLKTSLRIWTDSIFANGSNMLGQPAPETSWAGINTLIGLVDEHYEYMESVVLSFCAFLRPPPNSLSRQTPMKSNEQKVRIFGALNRWLKTANRDRNMALDFQKIVVSGIQLDSICLAGGSLPHIDLHASSIEHVDFSGCDLVASGFIFTSLRGCKFDGAKLANAAFIGVDLTGCTFDGANIEGMGLSNGSPTDAKPEYPHGTRLVVTKAQLQQAEWSPDHPPKIESDVVDAETGERLTL